MLVGNRASPTTMILAAALPPRYASEAASPPIALAWRQGLLCAPVSLGEGLLVWMVVDTGARRSFLARSTVRRLLDSGAQTQSDGSLAVEDLRIGGYPVGALRLAPDGTDDESHLAAAEGLLGMDLLHRYRVGLDLREKTLRLWPAGTEVRDWFTAAPESLVRLPIQERPEGWCVPVEVGNLTVPMVLDTGSSDTYVHTEVAKSLRGARKAKRDPGTLRFYDGLHRVRAYTVPTLGLGGVSLGERTVGVASVPRMVGLLGRDVFGSLKLLLDYPAGTATLAGLEGGALPVLDGPAVTYPNGVVVRWPRGVVVSAPLGCAYTLPAGYREVVRADESVDLVPSTIG